MLFLISILLCLLANFVFLKAEENGTISISITHARNCTAELATYQFTEGQNISVVILNQKFINFGWVRRLNSSGSRELIADIKEPNSRTILANTSIEGIWEFEFLDHIDNTDIKTRPIKLYKEHNYTVSICRLNISIVPVKEAVGSLDELTMLILLALVVGAIALVIITAQAGYIIYLKAKSKALDRHRNLSKTSETAANDTARYCTNPGQKLIIEEEEEIEADYIYEAPNIEIPGRMPASLPQQHIPPQLPAVTTMPRTPRSDHSKLGPQSMLAGAMRGPIPTPMFSPGNNHSTFPRPKHAEREMNIASRPVFPLPPANGDVEEYEEMEPEENVYEDPKIATLLSQATPGHNLPNSRAPNKPTQRPRFPTPTASAMPFPKPKMKTEEKTHEPPQMNNTLPLKHRPGPVNKLPLHKPKPAAEPPKLIPQKPSATPKPQLKTTPTQNELEEAFKRRNNVKQVPIVSIPDPSASKGFPAKPRPVPPVQSKSRSPPVPQQPFPEEIYSHESHDSSDEEWTYEPLKSVNGYNSDNIYYNE